MANKWLLYRTSAAVDHLHQHTVELMLRGQWAVTRTRLNNNGPICVFVYIQFNSKILWILFFNAIIDLWIDGHLSARDLNQTFSSKQSDNHTLAVNQPFKGKSSPITCTGRRIVTGFYAFHFSISQVRYGGAYLLSIVVKLYNPPSEGSYQLLVGHLEPRIGFEPLAPGSPMIGSQVLNAFSHETQTKQRTVQ